MADLADIGRAMRTQDNRCTGWPIFVVQEKRRLYGMDPQYADVFAWLYDDECVEVDAEKAKELEAKYDETCEEPSGYRRVAYIDQWHVVQPFFTEDGAKDYLAINGHNLKEVRIYVESGYRNAEWQRVREFLLSLPPAPDSEGTP